MHSSARRFLFLFVLGSVVGCGNEGPQVEGAADANHAPPEMDDAAAPCCDTGELESEAEPMGTLTVADPTLELGTVDPRCAVEAVVSIENTGDAVASDLTVTASADWAGVLSETTLAPGQATDLTVSWTGAAQELQVGEFLVEGAGLAGPLLLLATVSPTLPEAALSTPLGDRTTADLLLAVDRSCNMDEMTELEPSWPTLRRALSDHGIDLRMASVVAEDACILGEQGVVDGSLSDAQMRDILWEQQEWGGAWTRNEDQLLAKSVLALSQTGAGDCNSGLHASDRPLHVLAFSDEPDQSPEDWSAYLPQLEAFNDPGLPAVVHGVGDEADDGCLSASPYWGVLEAAEATGGGWVRWCSTDWDGDVTALADRMAEIHHRVELDRVAGFDPTLPVEAYTAVAIGGASVDGWRFDTDHTAIVLSESTSMDGTLTVSFTPAAACGG
jgi:hypothetical protein